MAEHAHAGDEGAVGQLPRWAASVLHEAVALRQDVRHAGLILGQHGHRVVHRGVHVGEVCRLYAVGGDSAVAVALRVEVELACRVFGAQVLQQRVPGTAEASEERRPGDRESLEGNADALGLEPRDGVEDVADMTRRLHRTVYPSIGAPLYPCAIMAG